VQGPHIAFGQPRPLPREFPHIPDRIVVIERLKMILNRLAADATPCSMASASTRNGRNPSSRTRISALAFSPVTTNFKNRMPVFSTLQPTSP
jgi:hypothetical protein